VYRTPSRSQQLDSSGGWDAPPARRPGGRVLVTEQASTVPVTQSPMPVTQTRIWTFSVLAPPPMKLSSDVIASQQSKPRATRDLKSLSAGDRSCESLRKILRPQPAFRSGNKLVQSSAVSVLEFICGEMFEVEEQYVVQMVTIWFRITLNRVSRNHRLTWTMS